MPGICGRRNPFGGMPMDDHPFTEPLTIRGLCFTSESTRERVKLDGRRGVARACHLNVVEVHGGRDGGRRPHWRIRGGGRLGDGELGLLHQNQAQVVGGILRRVTDGLPPSRGPLEVERGVCDSSPMRNFNREMKQRRDPRRVGLKGRTSECSERLICSTNLRWNHLRDVLAWRAVGSDSWCRIERERRPESNVASVQFKSVSRSPPAGPAFRTNASRLSPVGQTFILTAACVQSCVVDPSGKGRYVLGEVGLIQPSRLIGCLLTHRLFFSSQLGRRLPTTWNSFPFQKARPRHPIVLSSLLVPLHSAFPFSRPPPPRPSSADNTKSSAISLVFPTPTVAVFL